MEEMKCPLCGGRMLRGHLSAGRYRIIWTEKPRRLAGWREPGDLEVEPLRRFSDRLQNTADRCLLCGVILVRRGRVT